MSLISVYTSVNPYISLECILVMLNSYLSGYYFKRSICVRPCYQNPTWLYIIVA